MTVYRHVLAKNSPNYQVFDDKIFYIHSPSMRTLTVLGLVIYPYEFIARRITDTDEHLTIVVRDLLRVLMSAVLIKVCFDDQNDIKEATF